MIRVFDVDATRTEGTRTETIVLPKKIREMHNHHFDSTIWNDLYFRDDDIVISTYAKSGTTWMQQIVAQLLFGPDPDLEVAEMSPWLDLRVPPKEIKLPMVEAQTHRRFLKTHLPMDALLFSPKAKYIYIGRDGRDVVWSMYNHHANANQLWYELLNDTPGRVGPPIEAAPRGHPAVLPRLDGPRRPPLLAVLGERAHLVGDSAPPERPVRALREPEARHAGPDAPHRRVPRCPHRRDTLGGDPRVLLLRLDEAQRHERAFPSAAPSGTPAPRSSSTRGSTAAGPIP